MLCGVCDENGCEGGVGLCCGVCVLGWVRYFLLMRVLSVVYACVGVGVW